MFLQTTFAQNPAFDSLADEINRMSIYKKTRSLELLDSLYAMANNHPDSSLMLARCFFEESILNLRQGIFDTLLTYRINERLVNKSTSLLEQALLQSALGVIIYSAGNYSETFTLQLQAYEKFKQLNNNRFMAKSLNLMGVACHLTGLNNLAEYYYSEAIKLITPDYFEYHVFKNNLFKTSLSTEALIDSLCYSIEIAEKKNFVELLPMFYLNLVSLYIDTDTEKASLYFEKLQSLDFDGSNTSFFFQVNMGKYYLIKKEISNAKKFYIEAQIIAEQSNLFFYLPLLYSELSIIFEAQNQLDSALFYSRKSLEITEKLRSNTVALETHQRYITTFLEASQKDLIISEQKNALKTRLLTIIAIVLFLLILLFFIFYQHKRRKTKETETKLKYEKELLDSKTRELSTYSLLVSNKNQILNEISELNVQAFNNKEAIKKIDEIIKNNFSIDKEWDIFKMHFDSVHPDFFTKLTKRCSKLTDENLKLCAYIKMGISTKQIAQILNILPETVRKNKYHIKSKLKITDSEANDLNSFLRKF